MVPYKVDILMWIRNPRWPSSQGFVFNIGLNGWLFTKFWFFIWISHMATTTGQRLT